MLNSLHKIQPIKFSGRCCKIGPTSSSIQGTLSDFSTDPLHFPLKMLSVWDPSTAHPYVSCVPESDELTVWIKLSVYLPITCGL